MADDSQGFDWSALMQSATPFAAALIPAALGAIAGGRGGAATGAATGFASGMRGQVEEQQQYEKQRAQVEEANQRAAIQQQEAQLRAAEFKQRQQHEALVEKHMESQMEVEATRKKELEQKMRYYELTDKHQEEFADRELKGAQKEAFLAMDRGDRSNFMKEWPKEQARNNALPGLARTAVLYGLPPQMAEAAVGTKQFDSLFNFVTHAINEKNKKKGEGENLHLQLTDYLYTNPTTGDKLPLAYNSRTGTWQPTKLGPDLAPGGTIGKPEKEMTPAQEEALIRKRFHGVTGIAPSKAGTEPEEYEAKRAAFMASPYGEAAVNIKDEKEFERTVKKLKTADTKGIANARKDYLSQVPAKGQLKPTEEGFQKYIDTPAGKEFLEGHKELARAGQTPQGARKYWEENQPAAIPVKPSSTVKMRAPDGSERDVPANQVEEAKRRGATVVGK